MDLIKSTVAKINANYNSGSMSEAQYRECLLNEWLMNVVTMFVDKYGVTCIPLDIRNAINDISNELGTKVVDVWPIVKYETVDMNVDVVALEFSMV